MAKRKSGNGGGRAPQPRQRKQGNGKTARPLPPEKLCEFLKRKESETPEGWWLEPASEKQYKLVVQKLEECFALAEDSNDRYHAALKWLWGVESAKEPQENRAASQAAPLISTLSGQRLPAT